MTHEQSRALELSELAKRATPGPWRSISDAQHPANRRITSDDRPHIAKVYGTHLGDEEDGEANAAFIAAFNPKVALELLDALLSDQRRAEEAERVARLHAQNEVSAMGRACDERARAEAAESQLQRLRGALEEALPTLDVYAPMRAAAIRSVLSPTVGMGEEKASQSQPCGEASASAEVFAGHDAEPSAAEIARAAWAVVALEELDFERAIAKVIDPKAFEPSDDLTGLEHNQRSILRKQAVKKAAEILRLIGARAAPEAGPAGEGGEG